MSFQNVLLTSLLFFEKISKVLNFFFQDLPEKRPSVAKILQDDFLTQGYMPSRLPTSCLTMAPRFDAKMQQLKRGPLQEINKEVSGKCNVASICIGKRSMSIF